MLNIERIFAISRKQILGKILPRRKGYYNFVLAIGGNIKIRHMIFDLFKYQFKQSYFSCFETEKLGRLHVIIFS